MESTSRTCHPFIGQRPAAQNSPKFITRPAESQRYRFYQFYSNMSVAAAFAWMARAIAERTFVPHSLAATLGLLVLEIILLAGSRDTLQVLQPDAAVAQYASLLADDPQTLTQERSPAMTNGGHKKVVSPEKPVIRSEPRRRSRICLGRPANPRPATDRGSLRRATFLVAGGTLAETSRSRRSRLPMPGRLT